MSTTTPGRVPDDCGESDHEDGNPAEPEDDRPPLLGVASTDGFRLIESYNPEGWVESSLTRVTDEWPHVVEGETPTESIESNFTLEVGP